MRSAEHGERDGNFNAKTAVLGQMGDAMMKRRTSFSYEYE